MDRRADILRFGIDGWTARFDDGFTEENVSRVVDALALLWATERPGGTVYVGFDTRHGSEAFARRAGSVLASFGLRVRLSDVPCPTPAVAWACAHDPECVGAVIITASERSCEFGGVLVRGSDGGPVPRSFLDVVEQHISSSPSTGQGAYEECDIVGAYLDALSSQVDRGAFGARGLRVVVDAMYGAAVGHLADLLSDLGCDVSEIHMEPQEDFSGIHPVPQEPWADACEQAVLVHHADVGLMLDGDGDRAGIVDESGRLLPPRVVVPLVMEHLVRGHGRTGRVITTLTSSACVLRQAELLGLDTVSVPVGFSRIYREIVEGDVLLGAEEYGGICIPDHLRERDGLLVCLLVAEMLSQSGVKLSELVAGLESRVGSMCYARRDVHLEPAATQAFRNILPGLNPADVAGKVPVEVSHADGLRLQFEDDSWVMMRPSRAGALVRVYAEAATAKERDELLDAASEVVRRGIS